MVLFYGLLSSLAMYCIYESYQDSKTVQSRLADAEVEHKSLEAAFEKVKQKKEGLDIPC